MVVLAPSRERLEVLAVDAGILDWESVRSLIVPDAMRGTDATGTIHTVSFNAGIHEFSFPGSHRGGIWRVKIDGDCGRVYLHAGGAGQPVHIEGRAAVEAAVANVPIFNCLSVFTHPFLYLDCHGSVTVTYSALKFDRETRDALGETPCVVDHGVGRALYACNKFAWLPTPETGAYAMDP